MTQTALNGYLTHPQRFIFLGDSITEDGRFISYIRLYFQRYLPQYDAEFVNFGLSSETVSGLSEPSHPFPRPCIHERIDRILKELTREDVVLFCYGMNDGIYYPFSDERFAAYRNGIEALASRLKQTGCRVLAVTPPPFDAASCRWGFAGEAEMDQGMPGAYRGYDEVLARYADYIKIMPGLAGVVDIREPILDHIRWMRKSDPVAPYGDGVHPDACGHWVMARVLLKALFNITLGRTPDFVAHPEACPDYLMEQRRHELMSGAWRRHIGHRPFREEDAPELPKARREAHELTVEIENAIVRTGVRSRCEESRHRGYRRVDFYVCGRESMLMFPEHPCEGDPWLWRTEFFEAFDDADMAMLQRGYCRAYHCLADMYGNAEAMESMRAFYETAVSRFGLNERPVLVGLSRGGLYAVNFASRYPEKTGLLYLDAPLVDVACWPTTKNSSFEGARAMEECTKANPFVEAASENETVGAQARMAKLAGRNVPVFIVSGDSDRVVPYEKNGLVLQRIYEAAGGDIEVILKPGVDHHPHGLPNPDRIIEFIEGHVAPKRAQ